MVKNRLSFLLIIEKLLEIIFTLGVLPVKHQIIQNGRKKQ